MSVEKKREQKEKNRTSDEAARLARSLVARRREIAFVFDQKRERERKGSKRRGGGCARERERERGGGDGSNGRTDRDFREIGERERDETYREGTGSLIALFL